ncbi:MAG: ATP-binding protein [Bacillota bacterium]|nr:ATP-binding protein [Bacillota bacterium]
MAYDRRLAAKVAQDFAEKRQKRESLISARRQELYDKIPELKTLEDEIARSSFSAFRQVASGLDADSAAQLIYNENKKLTDKRDSLIKKAGYKTDYINPPYHCSLCKDTGFLDNSYCKCFKSELVEAAFGESNLASLSKNTFDKFSLDWYSKEEGLQDGISPYENMKSVLAICKNYVSRFETEKDSLLFCGPSGLGKTFLSSCIANELLRSGVSVVYQSSGAVFALLERVKFNKNADEADLYAANRIIDSDLFILDDLGTEFITDYSMAELFRILNTRQISEKKTIVSTNLSVNDLRSTYSERILSRLLGGFSLVRFYGKDIRLKKKYSE